MLSSSSSEEVLLVSRALANLYAEVDSIYRSPDVSSEDSEPESSDDDYQGLYGCFLHVHGCLELQYDPRSGASSSQMPFFQHLVSELRPLGIFYPLFRRPRPPAAVPGTLSDIGSPGR